MPRLRNFVKPNWPYLLVGGAPLILFAPFLLGRAVLYWGTPLFQFYPWREFALDVIHSGHLPLWNPYIGNGVPLIANYQSAVFYPPNWLSLVFPLAYSFSWLVVLHLIWAGAGMVVFTRSLGLKPFGQAVSGLAFGLSQYLITRAAFLSFNVALAWLPWIIWAADRSLLTETRKSLKYALLLTLFVSLQLLAGHAQTTWYTMLLLAAWSLYRMFTNHRIRVARLAFLAAFLLLAAGLASIQLIPTAEFLGQSSRASDYEYQAAVAYSYSPARLLTLFAPDLFGNPARGTFFGYGFYWEDADYIGLLPLLLALGLVFSAVKSSNRSLDVDPAEVQSAIPRSLIFFLVITMMVTLILALGSNTPVFPFLYQHVPSFNMFQAPTRMMVWFEFSLALLAGMGADLWKPPQQKTLYWTRMGLAGAITLASIGGISYLMVPAAGKIGNQIHFMAVAIGLAGVILALSAILSLSQPAVESPQRFGWSILVTVFVALDLIYANWGINPGAPPEIYAENTTDILPIPSGQRIFEYPSDNVQIKYNLFLNIKTFGPPELAFQVRASEMANVNVLDRIASVNNYDPLTENRYSLLLRALDQAHNERVLALMNVGKVLSFHADNSFQFQSINGTPSRIWVVTSAQTVTDSALQALFAGNFDPAQTVILEANDKGVLSTHSIPYQVSPDIQIPSTSQILDDQPTDVRIAVNLPSDGWVVLSDTYYPGWFVYVDGQPARLLHADYAFRGVAVPAGPHLVEFRYEPFSFRLGSWITAISMVVFIGLFIGVQRLRI